MLFVDLDPSHQWLIAALLALFFFWQCLVISHERNAKTAPLWLGLTFILHFIGMVLSVLWLAWCALESILFIFGMRP